MKKLFTLLLITAFAFFLNTVNAQDNLLRWIAQGSSPDLLFGDGVSTDDQGNAYVTGYFNTTLALLGDTVEVTSDRNSMFLSKISPTKELIWTITAEADGPQGVTGFKTYIKNGYIYLIGDLRGSATFGSIDFSEITVLGNDFRTMYIAKYTTGGLLEWVRTVTTSNSLGMEMTGSPFDITVDNMGAVYVSTAFRNSVNIADVNVPDPTPDDNLFSALLFKLDANGAYQWHWNSTNTGADQGQALALNDDSSLFYAVKYSDSLTVGDHIANAPGFALIEFNLNGEYLWHQFMTNTTSSITGVRCFGIDFDEAGDIYLAGSYRTDILWDQVNGLNSVNTTRSDGFVIKIDGAERSWQWGKALGDPAENDEIKSISRNSQGNFMLAGSYRGVMELSDDLTLTSLEASSDNFWAVMDTEGMVTEAAGFGGTSNEVLTQMAHSPEGDTYMIGRFQNDFQYLPGDTLFTAWGSFDFFLVKLGLPSGNASLDQILIDETPLQGFQSDELNYEVFVSSSATEVPVVAGVPASAYAQVVVEQASSLQGTPQERTATITVTSENEENTQIYTILFDLMSDDATLASITIDGEPLASFDPQQLHYDLAYPSTVTDVPVVDAQPNDSAASVAIEQAVSFTGSEEERTATITVTSQDPTVSLTYTLTFRYLEDDATLSDILINDVSLEGFDPEVLAYEIVMPTIDPADFPSILPVPADENATVEISEPHESTIGLIVWWLVEIIVTSEDESVSTQYDLHFREVDTNALLLEILVDDVPVDGFDSQVFDYQVNWTHGTDQMPQVTAAAMSPYASVTVQQPTNLEGTPEERTAFISVVAENPEFTGQYTVLFNLSTSVSEFSRTEEVLLYPNPVGNTLQVFLPEKVSEVRIIDISGATLRRIANPGMQLSLDVSDLPAGMYFIHMLKDNSRETISGSFIRK
ncbi:MAG: cadherin-like beta sandwich domain-containing protein [Bacteroidota bacterium]